jgi:hypothetical protein
MRKERERRKREKCSSENGKMLLECDVLALARASKRKEETIDLCYPFLQVLCSD